MFWCTEKAKTLMMTTVVIQTIARVVVPFLQLFGLYIIVHGPVSPGGGFQGGVIVGASMILLALSYDLSSAETKVSHKVRIAMDSTGALLFAGIGLLCLLAGGVFLEYGIIPLPMVPAEVRGLMILLVGVAIGIHIMALAASLFLHLAEEHDT
ncbi:sodium:proton antiporter [Dehalococcoidia bacterium]|nr:sodium:proton antiporter [Dehalococcoidia bacterium]MCL0073795.1 sodium:proton antiporter [Dehalococcoidia bacterium]